jgi:hypothetical protein
MTAEQYDKLTEMQRIKPKDDEEAKVTVVPILYTSAMLMCCVVLCCVVVWCGVLWCGVLCSVVLCRVVL